MSNWTFTTEIILAGRGVRFGPTPNDGGLRYDTVLDLLAGSPAFRRHLSELIVARTFRALRFETPPITRATVGRPFEFVLIDDPSLDRPPEPDVFAPHFAEEGSDDVRAVPNLGRDAMLIVPRQVSDCGHYVHLKRFLAFGPHAQIDALWQCLAVTARAELNDRPLWISTAGGGVAWLHVRLDRRPKYYCFRPYVTA